MLSNGYEDSRLREGEIADALQRCRALLKEVAKFGSNRSTARLGLKATAALLDCCQTMIEGHRSAARLLDWWGLRCCSALTGASACLLTRRLLPIIVRQAEERAEKWGMVSLSARRGLSKRRGLRC